MKSLIAIFVKIQLKKENLRVFFRCQSLGAQLVYRSPKQPGYILLDKTKKIGEGKETELCYKDNCKKNF